MSTTAWGLLASTAGVVVIAVSTPRVWGWKGTVYAGVEEPDWKSQLRKWGYFFGWGLLGAGFMLQLGAEVWGW